MLQTRTSLIRRVRDVADVASWREFVELYEPLLMAYAKQQGIHEHDARDIVQDILVVLLDKLPNFELDHDRGKFRTWLWRVVFNAVASWRRKRGREPRTDQAWLETGAAEEPLEVPEPDDAWVASVRRNAVSMALKRVQEQTKAQTWSCFELHILFGQGAADVAKKLETSEGAVFTNSSRVLDKVRAQCREYFEELADE